MSDLNTAPSGPGQGKARLEHTRTAGDRRHGATRIPGIPEQQLQVAVLCQRHSCPHVLWLCYTGSTPSFTKNWCCTYVWYVCDSISAAKWAVSAE